MKNFITALLIVIITFLGIFLIIWLFTILPYPHCTKNQIEITKQELIDGILEREIKLRELYSIVNGKKFIQTKKFKQQLQKEKDKFYKYCNNDGSSNHENRYCEINKKTSLSFMDRYSSYTLKYSFDEESKLFFNQITTYWGYEKFSTNPTGYKKNWHDRFWRAIEDKELKLLHPTKINGYSSEYNFFNCNESQEHWLIGLKELELANKKPMMKESLTFIESKSILYKSISSDDYASFEKIKTYILKEKQ